MRYRKVDLSRTYHYVLLTRCRRCALLKGLGTEPFNPQYKQGRYVMSITNRETASPNPGGTTIPKGYQFTVKEGEQICVYGCPRNPKLTFVLPEFAEKCSLFKPVRKGDA